MANRACRHENCITRTDRFIYAKKAFAKIVVRKLIEIQLLVYTPLYLPDTYLYTWWPVVGSRFGPREDGRNVSDKVLNDRFHDTVDNLITSSRLPVMLRTALVPMNARSLWCSTPSIVSSSLLFSLKSSWPSAEEKNVAWLLQKVWCTRLVYYYYYYYCY